MIKRLFVCCLAFASIAMASSRHGVNQEDNQFLAPGEVVEIDWSPIDRLTKAVTFNPSGTGYGDYYCPFSQWEDGAKFLLRKMGLAFYDKYPNDSRRWKWLLTTLKNEPSYLKTYPDDGAAFTKCMAVGSSGIFDDPSLYRVEDYDSWHKRRDDLIKACLASSQTSPDQRAETLFCALEQDWEDDRHRAGSGKQVDWSLWNGRIIDFASKCRTSTYPCTIAKYVLGMMKHYSPQLADPLYAAMKASPSVPLRSFANSDQFVALAKTEPMQMHFTALDGRPVDLAKLRGKVVLINFWATWCGHCISEFPAFKELYQKYRQQGFEIVGITMELQKGDRAKLLNLIKREQLPWPQYFDGLGFANPYAVPLGIEAAPCNLLLDKSGHLSQIIRGSYDSRSLSVLEPMVRRLLGLNKTEGNAKNAGS